MPAWWEHLLHIATGRVSTHDHLPDLRQLATQTVALERTHYLVNDRERHDRGSRAYVLRLEKRSRAGHTGVAVFANGRGVGHLPAHIADDIGPLLGRIGGAALVDAAGTRAGSIRLRVHVPTLHALREFVRDAPDRLCEHDRQRHR